MDNALVVLHTMVPVLAIILLGYALGLRASFDIRPITELTFDIAAPAFVFSILARSDADWSAWGTLILGTVWVVAITGGLVCLVARSRLPEMRGMLLPAMFWNGGNLGIPCATLAFGPEAAEAAAIVFVTLVCLHSSLGVWIAGGAPGELWRVPLVPACVAGVVVAVGGFEVPALVFEPIRMVGEMAIPLMLIQLGYELRRLEMSDLSMAITVTLIRMAGGIAAAVVFVALSGLDGVARQVMLLTGVLPAAVINVIFAQRYGRNPGLVASSIVLSTLISLGAIPLALALLV